MDFRGLVRKRVWKITFFGLKSSQDLKNLAAHPHQEFPGVLPPPPSRGEAAGVESSIVLLLFSCCKILVTTVSADA